ncbi:MAG: MauE/DoxX family redox-associated membrane protein [Bacteroidota bacterium]
MDERINTRSNKAINLVVATFTGAFTVMLLLSRPLWMQVRDFPLIPAFTQIDSPESDWLGYLLLLVLIVFLAGMNSRKLRQFSAIGVLLTLLVFIVLDLSRLQAWVFMFVLMIFPFLANDIRSDKNREKILICLRLILVFTYFWSGFHKLNAHFIEGTFPWMLSGVGWLDFMDNQSFAWMVPFVEMGMGGLLAFKKTRKIGVLAIAFFHLFILLLLGPLGHNWNLIVWPWNLLMVVLSFLLFWYAPFPHKGVPMIQRNLMTFKPAIIIVVIAGVMPFFHVFGKWDNNLSFSMYTGLGDEAVFYFSEKTDNCIPREYDKLIFGQRSDIAYLAIDDWALDEMKVPAYVNARYYKRLGKKWCSCLKNKEGAGIEILRIKGRWKTDTEFVKIPCSDL